MKSFKIDLYDVTINILCCEKWRDEVQRILAKEDYEEEKDLENADGFAMKMPGKNGFYVCFSPDISDSTVYHECIHLLIFVMNCCHLILDVTNTESIAYLGEYIIDNVMRIKNQHKNVRTIKNPSKRGTLTKRQAKKAVREVIAKREQKK